MRNNIYRILIIFFLLAAFCFPQDSLNSKNDSIPKFNYSTTREFWNQMDDIFNDPNFNNAYWGVVIQSLETGEYFYKRNSDIIKPERVPTVINGRAGKGLGLLDM